VADFVGEGVFLDGTVLDEERVETALGILGGGELHGFPTGTALSVLIRPDDVIHDDDSPKTAKVLDKAFRGSQYLYTLEIPDGTHVLSLVPSHHRHAQGEKIGIHIEMDHLVAFRR
jgi:iron(III) transport system ATP-binding protein